MKNQLKSRAGWLGIALLMTGMLLAPVISRAAGDHEHGAHARKTSAHQEDGQGRHVTVTGEVVDMSCFMGHEATGKKHRKCAQACLLKGLPAGILTDSGELYLVVESHDKKSQKAYRQAVELGGFRVEVQGKKFMRNGMMAIAVTGVKKVK